MEVFSLTGQVKKASLDSRAPGSTYYNDVERRRCLSHDLTVCKDIGLADGTAISSRAKGRHDEAFLDALLGITPTLPLRNDVRKRFDW
jgi:hypothetical protein